MFSLLQTIIGYTMMVIGGYISLLNWLTPIISKRSGRNVSVVPLIGATFLGAGIFTLTGSILLSLIAIPLDLGTLLLPFGIAALVPEIWFYSRWNHVQRFVSQDHGREIQINLYKNSKATITFIFDARRASRDLPFLAEASWTAQWKEILDGIELYELSEGGSLMLQSKGNNYQSIEKTPASSDSQFKLDGLQFEVEKDLRPRKIRQ